MSRDYLIKRVNNRIELNQEAIMGHTAADLRLVINNNNELLQLIKTELENTENSDDSHNQGMHDIWGMFQKFFSDEYNPMILEKVFGFGYIDEIVERMTPEDALEKFKAYEQKKMREQRDVIEAAKPVVGDVVIHSNANDKGPMTFIVININDAEIKGLRSTGETCSFIYPNSYIKKTGKHVDLEGLFE